MGFKWVIFCGIFFLYMQHSFSQRNFQHYNFLGIQGGLTIFDIKTEDLVTAPNSGFTAGFTTRGAFRNNFDLVYGINFQSVSLGVEGNDIKGSKTQNIKYTVQGAQISFLGSYNLIVKHLSLEFGPIFSINGKLKLDDETFKDYILTGYDNLAAGKIEGISRFNALLAGGITVGLEHFRLQGQYHYGLTNMLGNLNDNGLEKTDFKGNSSTFLLSAVVYF